MNLYYKKNPLIEMNERIHDSYTQLYCIYFTFPNPRINCLLIMY